MNFFLFLIGLILTVIGWFIEKSERFKKLRNLIAPAQNRTIETLESLAFLNEAIVADSLQGKTLLSVWPKLNDKSNITYIARTCPYQKFSNLKIENDAQLIAYTKEKIEVARWVISEAKTILSNQLNKRLFIIGAVIFWAGFGIALISGLSEFLIEKTTTPNTG